MKYLAIDTSGDLIVVAYNGDKKAVRYLKGCTAQHSLTLMPDIEEVILETEVNLNDFDFYAVVTGPGSFTGIRIGISTIKALCFACNKKVLPLTAFDCLAYDNNAPEKAFCIIDANHGNYYCAAYIKKQLVLPPCFMTEDVIKQKSEGFTIVASKDVPFADAFTANIEQGLENGVIALKNNVSEYENIAPLYVKKSQAEEESCK